jgi:hypothetical protein
MQLLLDAGARTDIHLAGFQWGKGFDWETIFFDVTPISYAQIGLMPQVHRCEADIYNNIQTLLNAAKRRFQIVLEQLILCLMPPKTSS